MITLILGRDGMGTSSNEADFDKWVSYVCKHIDGRCGFSADVDIRGERDVQDDTIVGGTDAQRYVLMEAKNAMWAEWCADGAP